MKRNLNKVHVLAMVLLMGLPIISMAQQGGDDSFKGKRDQEEMGPRGDRKEGGMMEAIPNLTDDQKEKIKTIHTKAQADMLPVRNKINEKEASLQTLQTAAKVDMKAINSTIDELSALRGQMEKRQALAHQDVRALLTEDQRLFVDTHLGGRGGRDRGFGHGGDGRGK